MKCFSDSEMEQKYDFEIDRQYIPSKWSHRGVDRAVPIYLENISNYSKRFREKSGHLIETLRYGQGLEQMIDIVKPADAKEDSKIVIFIHGGFWTETSRDMYTFMAEPILNAGMIAVIIGYDLAPDVTITTIVKETQEAYLFLCSKFPKCKEMTVTGHSAGGHLVSMLLGTNWDVLNGAHRPTLIPITSCVPLNGIFDLQPLRVTTVHHDVNFSNQELHECSPMLRMKETIANCKKFRTTFHLVIAEYDPPGFIKQAAEYNKLLQLHGIESEVTKIADIDHFEGLEKFIEPDFQAIKILLNEL